MTEPVPEVETAALEALTEMRRADARLTRLEAQLDVVGQAVGALRTLLAEEVETRRRLMAEHAGAIEAEARAEYATLCARLDTVRAAYDQLAASLDDTIQRHAERQIDDATFARVQRTSSDALRARAAELAQLDQVRARFEAAFGEAAAAAPAPAAPPPVAAAPTAAHKAAVRSTPPPVPPRPEAEIRSSSTKPVAAVAPAAVPAPSQPPAPAAPAASESEAPPESTPVPLADVPFPQPLPTPIPDADPAEPTAVLIETHPTSSGATHRLRDGLQIGRSIDNELRVLDPSVSRQHATIAIRSGAFVLEDLKSQNGTFVNGERIRQRVLCDGDRISIGEAEFIFRLDAAHQGGAPSESEPSAARRGA